MLPMPAPQRLNWRFIAGGAVLLTILFGIQQWAAQATLRRDLDLAQAIALQGITWGAWLVLLPLIVRVASRHPLEGRPTVAWVARTIVEGAAFVVVHALMAGTTRWAVGLSVAPDVATVLANSINAGFASNSLRYVAILTAYQVVVYRRAVREREQRAAQLEVDLAHAKLASLEACLRPHFLFNTLNAIAALVRDDPAAAEKMIGELSDLFRASLYGEPSREVRLEEELAFTEKYLGIERVRFHDRLTVRFDVSAEAKRALVPHLLLQPLVENAVRHGIAPLEAGGSIAVEAARQNGMLHVTVRDDGVGLKATATNEPGGIGLRGLRARLEHLYGDRHRVDLHAGPAGGAVVDIEIPYRTAQQ
jgi:two-component system, LytTR family, sensor kinase